MATDPITTNELIEARMDETGLTREQLLLVVAKSALVRHLATGPDKDRFVLKGGTLLAHVYKSPRQSVRDADYTYIEPALPTVDDLIEMLRVPGTNGFYLDPAEAQWTTGTDIYEAKGMKFSIHDITVARSGRGRGDALDISVSVRSGECLDGPIPLIYTDTMLAGESRFSVMGLSLEELGAEKVLGWASKDQARHYIDLAYIARDHQELLNADKAATLICEKFARERHSGRYRRIRNVGELASTFSAPARVKLIRDSWEEERHGRVAPPRVEHARGATDRRERTGEDQELFIDLPPTSAVADLPANVRREERVGQHPGAPPARPDDDRCVGERVQRTVGCLLLQIRVRGAMVRKADRDLDRSVAHGPDAVHQVGVPARIVRQRSAVAALGDRAVDMTGALLDRGMVGLLGDQHRRPRVPFARGDNALQRLFVDGAAVLGEALAESRTPLVVGNPRELMEAAELVQRAALVAEQIAHQMLDAAREQACHARGSVEGLAQPLGDLLGVAVGAAGELLKLVDQQDQLPVVALGDPLGQFEGEAQLQQRVAVFTCGLKSDLHRVAEFGLHAQHCRQRAPAERPRTEIARALEQPLDRRAVGERLPGERLGE